MRIACLPYLLLFCLALPAASQPAFIGKPDCRFAAVEPLPAMSGARWSGPCKDGHAEGKGVLEWSGAGDGGKRRLEAVLVRGEISGAATLDYSAGSYIGSVRQGLPHGAGYFKYKNGAQYEGGVVDGKPEGMGTRIAADGSTYEGEWKAGKRHGRGKEVFTLGGRYEGEWRDNEFNGHGTIVYGGSGRTWSGEFLNGYATELTPARRRASGTNDDEAASGSAAESGSSETPGMPADLGWEALPAFWQLVVRGSYPALDDRDEPPFLLAGMRTRMTKDLTRHYTNNSRRLPEGRVLVHVKVGADGRPLSARVYQTPHPDLGGAVVTALMKQRFRPARCAGTPCEMIFPFMFSFAFE